MWVKIAMKTLLLIPSRAKSGVEEAVASDQHPTMDYHALQQGLAAAGDDVELLDYAAVEQASHPLVRMVQKVVGIDAALSVLGFLRSRSFDAVFTNAENVALPLAMLFKLLRRRPRHVTIAHRLTTGKKRLFYRWLKLHREMDVIFVYSALQRDFARDVLGIPADRVRLIAFHADARFYRSLAEVPVQENQICSAGLEWRDYPTLIDAVADETELVVKLAAASPWSKHENEVQARTLPAHVDARRYDYRALRELYAQSSFVVVPLYQNDFQAGVTTILEAMAMGKAVVVTGTLGQTDVIVDGINGLYVAPGAVQGWRDAIARLRADSALRVRLGQAARRWLEENASLDRWVEQLVAGMHGEPQVVTKQASNPATASEAENRGSSVQLKTPADGFNQAADA
jgi:glycosyltransferase involved in cell wall biosynthesis